MALSICRRVESLMPRAEGRRHETLAEAGPQAGTPGSFRNRGRASACTAGGQTGRSAQVREYMPGPGGDYIMTAGRGPNKQYRNRYCYIPAYHRQAWVIEAW